MHIDKMIAINGLPKDWMFRERADGSKELAPPFQADNEDNIPKHIRYLCTPEDIVTYFSPINSGVPGVIDKKKIYGVKLDYMTEPGRSMWERIRKYLDATIPRDQQVPEPVLVAKDQKGPFETFSAHRRVTGGIELEPSEIPLIDLDKHDALDHGSLPPSSPPVSPQSAGTLEVPTPAPQPEELFHCKRCEYTSTKKQAVVMHNIVSHKKPKEGVPA